jgi:hypothetical protein
MLCEGEVDLNDRIFDDRHTYRQDMIA